MKTLVIIPAYNEEANIGRIVAAARIYVPEATVLVVDDGSTDRTQILASNQGATVVSHGKNKGYGCALQTGYRFAVGFGFDTVLQLDADGQHDPKYLPVLLDALHGADVVIGSRFLNGPTYHIPFFRRTGMKLFSSIGKMRGLKISDTTSGYRALSYRAILSCIDLEWEYPDANLLLALHRRGLKIIEIPVTMYANREGKSMHSGLEPVRYVAKMLYSTLLVGAKKA